MANANRRLGLVAWRIDHPCEAHENQLAFFDTITLAQRAVGQSQHAQRPAGHFDVEAADFTATLVGQRADNSLVLLRHAPRENHFGSTLRVQNQ